eukprot:s4443_g3.t1
MSFKDTRQPHIWQRQLGPLVEFEWSCRAPTIVPLEDRSLGDPWLPDLWEFVGIPGDPVSGFLQILSAVAQPSGRSESVLLALIDLLVKSFQNWSWEGKMPSSSDLPEHEAPGKCILPDLASGQQNQEEGNMLLMMC